MKSMLRNMCLCLKKDVAIEWSWMRIIFWKHRNSPLWWSWFKIMFQLNTCYFDHDWRSCYQKILIRLDAISQYKWAYSYELEALNVDDVSPMFEETHDLKNMWGLICHVDVGKARMQSGSLSKENHWELYVDMCKVTYIYIICIYTYHIHIHTYTVCI